MSVPPLCLEQARLNEFILHTKEWAQGLTCVCVCVLCVCVCVCVCVGGEAGLQINSRFTTRDTARLPDSPAPSPRIDFMKCTRSSRNA